MDALPRFVEQIKREGWARQNLLGFFHVLIGRRITRQADGALVSSGVTWRDLAALIKKVRWDPDNVRELGIDPKELPPRDRERYWYVAIMRSQVDSAAATQAGDAFARVLGEHGYDVGPPPGAREAEAST